MSDRLRALVATAVLASCAPWSLSRSGDAPLCNEDVVRLFAAGRPAAALIGEIRSRDVEFDLSEEMLAELEIAGLPADVIRAMVERQAELHPSVPAPAPTAGGEPVAPVLRVRLASGGGQEGPPVLRLDGRVDARLAEAWGLPPGLEGRPFEDLALYLVCLEPTHVGDHWRSSSPLGRDFVSMQRHEMLAFLSGARSAGGAGGEAQLELSLPPALEVALEPAETHDLALGIAVQVGGRYYRVTDDVRRGVVLAGAALELGASLRQGRGDLSSLRVQFEP